MTARHLPANFALQSTSAARLGVSQSLDQDGVVALLVEASAYPCTGVIGIEGLRPDRHYLLKGATRRFCRTGAEGAAQVEVALIGPTLFLMSPLV